jgi:hypothetical protein
MEKNYSPTKNIYSPSIIKIKKNDKQLQECIKKLNINN